MVSIYLIFFFFGIISYILFKIIFKTKAQKVKYIKIKPIIENKKFTESSDSILREQLDRNYLFFGDEGMKLIKSSTVAIFDCQTLGSIISVVLARSGIKKLILIDNKILSIENYKYHPFAVLEDINKNNLDLFDNYLRQLNPNIELILIKEKINYDNLSKYFNKESMPNYIVDCIDQDNIISKCKLIKFATDNLNQNCKFISTFPPLKFQNDPTQIKHSKFTLVDNASISSLILENYKKLYNIGTPDFTLVYSNQRQNFIEKDSSLNKNIENLFCYGVISDSVSSIILCDLAKFEVNQEHIKKENEEEIKIASKTLSEAIEDYKKEEIEKRKVDAKYLNALTYNDFKLICLGFKNGSCIKQKPTGKMRFVRWRMFKEPSKNNIVLMGKSEINLHLKIHNEKELIEFYTKSVVDRIDGILNSI